MVNPLDVPVDPNAPIAQQWVIDELSKPAYQAARPTLFDIIAKAIQDWLDSLHFGAVSGPPALGIGVLVALVIIAIVVAFLVFGAPRLNRKTSVTGSLFGEDDTRNAARIRKDAEAAARAGDYSVAIIEMFRAIARGLAERTVVTTSPGTTAQDFAAQAARAFPAYTDRLRASAESFDAVRYLDREGTYEQFDAVGNLERDLSAAKPLLDSATPSMAGV